MKKLAVLFTLATLSTSISATDLCTKYENNKRFMKAIETVAEYQNYSKEEFCTLGHVMDVEVQPSRIIDREGNVIPHARVQQHKTFDSCLYMVNELDYSITQAYCYSGT
jgi:hypothetical protein